MVYTTHKNVGLGHCLFLGLPNGRCIRLQAVAALHLDANLVLDPSPHDPMVLPNRPQLGYPHIYRHTQIRSLVFIILYV